MIACHDIAHTDSRQEMNEILVEAVGGILGGLAYGLGVSTMIVLMATPVGWVAALVIAGAGAGVSYGVGKIARNAYSMKYGHVDLVRHLSLDGICSP